MLLNDEEQKQLLLIAKQAIGYGLETGKVLPISLTDYSVALNQARATFVTLELNQQLRGCIGMLEAVRPLILDVTENAFAAAFRDNRFAPVTPQEFAQLAIHISILTPAEQIYFESEADFMQQLRPRIDGIILVEEGRRATFLPSVWEALPEPGTFIGQLKRKAGLPERYWSETIKAYRYTTELIE